MIRSHRSPATRRTMVASIAFAVLTLTLCAPHARAASTAGTMTPAAARLRQTMRTLWQDHVLWTRLVIVSTAGGLADLDPTTQRLLRNQEDLGNAIKPYYGNDAGNKLTELLRTHILQAAAVLAAAKANNAASLDSAKAVWFSNANDIATFLTNANPKSWPDSTMRRMMKDHLELTLAEASDQLQGRYTQSVDDYDRVQAEILTMADALSDGIVTQFPKKF